MRTALGMGLLILVWWVLTHAFDLEMILPTPEETVESLVDELGNVEFWRALVSTILKGSVVVAIVIGIGTPLGMAMGLNDTVASILRPAVMLIQSVPVISWLALVIFLWGIGWKGPITISSLSLLPIVILETMEGVRSTDVEILEVAKVYRVGFKKIFRDVYLGSLVPFILGSLEIVSGGVWKTVLVAEFLCGDQGIGVEISWARQFVDVPRVYALTSVAVFLGIGTERMVKYLSWRMEKRWGLR